jgi:hypothetical protein
MGTPKGEKGFVGAISLTSLLLVPKNNTNLVKIRA